MGTFISIEQFSSNIDFLHLRQCNKLVPGFASSFFLQVLLLYGLSKTEFKKCPLQKVVVASGLEGSILHTINKFTKLLCVISGHLSLYLGRILYQVKLLTDTELT